MPTALVIAAHPDDGEFGCAAYSARLAADGWDVYFLVTTNGAKGTEDRAMPRERLIAQRVEEQREACSRLGARDVFFLGFEDSELAYTRELVERIVWHLRSLLPKRSLPTTQPTSSSATVSINHPDHRATGHRRPRRRLPHSRDHLNSPSTWTAGLEPHKVRAVLPGTNHPNFDVAVTDLVDLKIHALSAHVSQFGQQEISLPSPANAGASDEGRYLERFRRLDLQF